ncbi:MAG: DUF411 domain-containing protein [Methylobacter tundripaludum]|uniref:Metal-binding protein n=1 Tax=Methylobacter tundripaludum TaxID=173365 RepID=A0A2S6GY28_9GAMM|nr:DUF411 domain-containing protein [Methylobacter tundripaludum]MCF7966499.1 DUF411 domain-containing protein [Methylobacter tundripaludum]MCK9636076.1 DUF411 domain-containing protein [Methylobacter tundripaludum]PPK70061.1 hypothetical protein B0F88_109162 [Methylobacter tundripaludum]
MKILKNLLIIGLLAANTAGVRAEDKPIDIVVHRSPSCTCCGKWLEHLKDNNFNVKDVVTNDVQAVKDKYGVSREIASCHTAIVDGYIVEGHVPANDIKTLLTTKSKVAGIAVPGMVDGSPGMEMGDSKDAYKVLSFDRENHTKVFNSYEGTQ